MVLQLVEDSPLLSPPPEKGARDAADVAEAPRAQTRAE